MIDDVKKKMHNKNDKNKITNAKGGGGNMAKAKKSKKQRWHEKLDMGASLLKHCSLCAILSKAGHCVDEGRRTISAKQASVLRFTAESFFVVDGALFFMERKTQKRWERALRWKSRYLSAKKKKRERYVQQHFMRKCTFYD